MNIRRLISSLLITTSLFLTLAGIVYAQNPILQDDYTTAIGIGKLKGQSVTLQQCIQTGDCSIQHILLLSNSIIRWAVAICGSIALLMYVIGGTWMIFSQGNQTRISRGKDIIIGTSISLIFILGSWLIVQFALQALGVKEQYQLQQNSCGGKPACPTGQVCYNNSCRDRCYVEKTLTDTTNPWQCQPLEECGFATVQDCEKNPSRCERFLCSGSNNRVCCWKP